MGGLGYSFGFDTNSSASLSSPFVNDAGIYFNGRAGSGAETEASTSSAVSTQTPSRQSQGGINPLPSTRVPVDEGLLPPMSSQNLLYYVAGGAVLLVLAVFFLLKK